MMTFATMGRLALASALLSVAVPAQDSTSRGVRIGLNYDPGSKPGIIVLPPVAWANGDSVRRILERDLDFSDRFNVISLPPPDASTVAAASGALNYPVFAKTGAVALVHVAPTARGVHVVLHDVAKAAVAREEDFSLPATVGRDWRHAVHGIADAIEQWITGTRGISQTRVAFIRSNVVRLIDSDGHGEEALPMVGAAVSPAWHPNGGTIAYNTFGTESRIVLHDLRTGRNREFPAQRNSMYLTPMFAPDGRSLVYAISTENGADLYQMSFDAEAFPRRVTVGRGSINVGASFSPDGNRMVFTSDRTGTAQVYIMDADGTNADIFTAFDFGDQNYRADPDWSPDGRQVTFQSRIDNRFQVFTMSLRDRQPKQLTSEGQNEEPSWAPDGRHLVFASTRSGTRQLWILDTESGRLRQLTHAGGSRLPAWSPRLAK